MSIKIMRPELRPWGDGYEAHAHAASRGGAQSAMASKVLKKRAAIFVRACLLASPLGTDRKPGRAASGTSHGGDQPASYIYLLDASRVGLVPSCAVLGVSSFSSFGHTSPHGRALGRGLEVVANANQHPPDQRGPSAPMSAPVPTQVCERAARAYTVDIASEASTV